MAKPVTKEIPYVEPLAAFQPFSEDPIAVFLDSADEGGGRGRFSYIAVDPVDVLIGDAEGHFSEDPFNRMRSMIHVARLETDTELPPFQTGICGFLSYELGGLIEDLPEQKGGNDFPSICVGLYDTIVAFDTFERRAWIVASDIGPGRSTPMRRIGALAEKLSRVAPLAAPASSVAASWEWELDRAAYEEAVRKTIDYIYAGDIFQANITARAVTQLPDNVDPFTLYRRLRWASPAPFAAYVSCGNEHKLLCASPERFLRLEASGKISARPIKGTRPRGDVPEVDAALAVELTESEKDRAENLMIVDLLRNDISRIALIGSVGVNSLCQLETFARVHHLVSEIVGRLRPGFDVVDLFKATFPGGSITGAPKIRAMEIINELEASRRGAYCGSVFWAGFDGAMDSNIVIRSMMISGDRVSANAGGGIVADSDPALEYEEMRTKIQPLLASLSGEQLS